MGVKKKITQLRVGSRGSRLALLQAEDALRRMRGLLPGLEFEIVPLSSPGDRDRDKDLQKSAADFFTRDLDEALLSGAMDLAVHSAKDVPDPVSGGLDWFWLPWREDPRDALVAAPGKSIADLPGAPRIGVSSDRREAYCRRRFPGAILAPIRGNIEDRLRQVDEGQFDLVLMAGAALNRLGLAERITEWIPLVDLPTPDGQGALAVTYRADNARLLCLRSLFVQSVAFVGAGVGSADLCTVAGVRALNRAEVCLYDALLDPALLDHLPVDAVRIDVGKRCGAHRRDQAEINTLLARYARRGLRVVRLKGGDPGIFGRLAEEVEALESLHLPYRVIPGVSSLSAATTGTGMLLTRRGVSRGFCAMSAREKGGKTCDVSGVARTSLPMVFFMGAGVVDEIVAQLLADGIPANTPAAIVYSAGADAETILRAPLNDIPAQARQSADSLPPSTNHPPSQSYGVASLAPPVSPPPGLLIVGDIAGHGFARNYGALRGKRVLLTCSQALLDHAADTVRDLGGRPLRFPLIRLTPAADADTIVAGVHRYDWIVLTSPSAVRVLFVVSRRRGQDVRRLPRIMVSGSATARELSKYGLNADLCPEADFGGTGLIAAARAQLTPGTRVLRLRSAAAGAALATALQDAGAKVDDAVLYQNEPVVYDALPSFDMAFFASGSAVRVFMDGWGATGLEGKTVTAIGAPTKEALEHYRIRDVAVPDHATVAEAFIALAGRFVGAAIKEES